MSAAGRCKSVLRSWARVVGLLGAPLVFALSAVDARAETLTAPRLVELPPGGVGELVVAIEDVEPTAAFHRDPQGRLTPLELSVRGGEAVLRFPDAGFAPGPATVVLDLGRAHDSLPVVLIQPADPGGAAMDSLSLADESTDEASLGTLSEEEERSLSAAARNERRLNHPPVGPNPDSAWLSIRPGGDDRPTRVELGHHPESETLVLDDRTGSSAGSRSVETTGGPSDLGPEERRLAVRLADAPVAATTRRELEREIARAAAATESPESELRRRVSREALRLLEARLDRLREERRDAIAREHLLLAEAVEARSHWRRHLPPAAFRPHVPSPSAARLVASTSEIELDSRRELRDWLERVAAAVDGAAAEARSAERMLEGTERRLADRIELLDEWALDGRS